MESRKTQIFEYCCRAIVWVGAIIGGFKTFLNQINSLSVDNLWHWLLIFLLIVFFRYVCCRLFQHVWESKRVGNRMEQAA